MAVRLEWAVLHHCKDLSYQQLFLQRNPGKKYTLPAITKATRKVLRDLGLHERQPT
jgi:hypothetical protein